MSENTTIIGHVSSTELGIPIVWEVHSDGRAYGDTHDDPVSYRWADGKWRTGCVSMQSKVVKASPLIERIYENWLATLIMTPQLPHRQ